MIQQVETFSTVARPMLSRDADSMYWMARYVERAEHLARLLLINGNLLTDVGDLAPHLQQRMWRSIPEVFGVGDQTLPAGREPLATRVQQYMTLAPESPNSLLNCLTRARENARAIRESISAEMWENVNAMYLSITAEDAPTRFVESHEDFYRAIMSGSMLFQGLTDQTLPHDQRWLFTQLAKYIERTGVTARIIETRYNTLRSADLETPIRNIHWMAVLRSCCSIEAYRREYTGDFEPLRVCAFLILQRNFPRSIRFCVDHAREAIAGIRTSIGTGHAGPAERVLGRLAAQLEYAEADEIVAEGVTAYVQKIQAGINDASLAVQQRYFLH